MAISLPNFQRISFDEANPTLTGFGRGQGLVQNMMMFPQQLKQAQLANMISQVQAQYAQPIANEDLQKAILQNKYYGPNMESEIGLRGAQTNMISKQAKYLPLKELIEATNSQRMASRFGQAYQLHSALGNMDKASRNLWISQHPQEYTQMINDMASQAANHEENPLSKILPQYFSELAKQSTPPDMPRQMNMPSVPGQTFDVSMPGQQENMAEGTIQPNSFQTNPEDVNQLQLSLAHQSNRSAVGAQQNRRADAAATMEIWLKDNQPQYAKAAKDASKYAGLIGKGQKGLDSIRSKSPESYQNLIWMRDSFIPNAINQVRMMEGMSASNKQREELRNTVSALQRWDLDPKSAINTFNKQIGTFQDVADAVFQGAEPNKKGTYRKSYNIPRIKENYINDNSNSYSDLSKLSDEELMRIAGGRS